MGCAPSKIESYGPGPGRRVGSWQTDRNLGQTDPYTRLEGAGNALHSLSKARRVERPDALNNRAVARTKGQVDEAARWRRLDGLHNTPRAGPGGQMVDRIGRGRVSQRESKWHDSSYDHLNRPLTGARGPRCSNRWNWMWKVPIRYRRFATEGAPSSEITIASRRSGVWCGRGSWQY